MTYKYLGDVGGGFYRYEITFRTYTNCDSTSNYQNGPQGSLTIGIYKETANPNDDKPLYTTLFMPLVDTNLITPETTDSCSVGSWICIHEGVYRAEVDLEIMPNNQFSNGYWLYYDRCCRNFSIINLLNPGTQGMVFSAFIPPPITDNSSPVFTDLPLPYICVNDTVGILNTAVDPDGDQLVFSFVDPYRGYSSTTNPAPTPPDPLIWPIPTVTWLNINYNMNAPFGPSGYAYINGSTGYSEYFSPNIGNHVVAVEIKEYRNNNLVGITRRDMQLLVMNCPNNPNPIFDYFSQQPTYSLEEGDSICFDIQFHDSMGDSLWLTANGQIFDTNFVNPAATIDTNQQGDSIVIAHFCWNTACGQGQVLPYLFTVNVTDNGCPPKTTPIVFSVEVIPFEGPDSISGPPIVCENDTVSYWAISIGGATYTWSISGGTILSGQGTDTVTVAWGPGPTGSISLVTTSEFGCDDGPITLPVLIQSLNADAGPDTTICLGDTVQIGGSPTAPNGTVINWSPATGLSSTTVANPWANPTSTTTYIVAVSDSFCIDYDTMVVTVGMATLDAGADTGFCSQDSVQLHASGGTSYQWTPSTGLSSDTIADPWASPTNTTWYYVTVTDTNLCVGIDSVLVSVFADPVIDAGPDTSICIGESVIIGGSPTGPNGSTYNWLPSSTLNDGSLANPVATPNITTTYVVYVDDSNGCSGVDSMTVTVLPAPVANATPSPDTTICIGDTIQLNASGGSIYAWSPTSGLDNPNIANPNAFPTSTTMYVVTVSDGNGCTDMDTVTVIISNPTADAGQDEEICIGDSVQLNASGGTFYAWTPSTGLSNPNISNPWASPIITTTYYVVVSDGVGCTSTDSVTVVVNALPIVDAGPDTALCLTDSVQIGGSPTGPGGSLFSWTPTTGLNNSTIANPMASPSTTTWYVVSVTDTNGCQNLDSCLVVVNSNPVADAGADASLCMNDSIQLNASGGIIYVWAPSSSLNNPNINNPWASPTTTTTYYVTVTDANGCTGIDSVTVSVDSLPFVDAGPDVWLCPGDSIQLNGSGPNGANVSWSPTTGLDNPNIYTPWASATDTIVYYLTVTDSNGCINVDSVTIIVNSAVPTDAGPDTSICQNDSVVIGGNPTSVNGTSYLWLPASGLNDNTIANPTASPSVTTTYIVYSTNDTCSSSDTVTVTVNPSPPADAGMDQQVCTGDSVQLNASGGLSYYWIPSTGLSNDTISNPWAHPNDTTLYYVVVTDGNGCTGIDSVIVIINPMPIVNAGPDIQICPGDSGQLNASGGISYAWTPASDLSDTSISNPWANPNSTTMYYVLVTDSNNCTNIDSVTVFVNAAPAVDAGPDTSICMGDSIQLNATGGVSYQWTPALTLSNDTINNPWANPSTTTMYYVKVTDGNGCTNIDSVTIGINPLPSITSGPDQQICIGDSIQLQASGGTSYTWSPSTGLSDINISNPYASPSDTIVYYVTGTDQNGCSNIDSVTVVVNPLPFAVAGNDTNICKGGVVQIGGNPTGPNGSVYSWTPTGSLDNATIANPTASPSGNTVYYLTVTDSNGCVNRDSVSVFIFSITSSPDTAICQGDSLQLGVFPLYGTSPYAYTWTPASDLSDTTIANPWCYTLTTNTYYVTVTDSNGCSENSEITVTVNNPPVAGFTTTLDASCAGVLAEFINTSEGASSYLWDFRDGQTSTDENTSHIFDYSSTISVLLTAYSSEGCTDTAFFTDDALSFEDYYHIVIPNVFSPNGDGINDWFEIEFGNKLQDCTYLKIYNRWGELMFQSEGNNHSWNGRTFAGEAVPEGIYFYIFKIRDQEFNGSITLLR